MTVLHRVTRALFWLRLPKTQRGRRFAAVRHLDENNATRRRVEAENRASLIATLQTLEGKK